jgi:putative FmdB family regulatory protein
VPTYQYTCTECGQPHEAVQSFTDPALTVCPSCGGKLRKVFSGVGVVFKGSGFYRTDSRAGTAKESSNGDKPAASPGKEPAASPGKEPAAAGASGSGSSSEAGSSGSSTGTASNG